MIEIFSEYLPWLKVCKQTTTTKEKMSKCHNKAVKCQRHKKNL